MKLNHMHTKMELVDQSLRKTFKMQRNYTNCAVDINNVSNSTQQTFSSFICERYNDDQHRKRHSNFPTRG